MLHDQVRGIIDAVRSFIFRLDDEDVLPSVFGNSPDVDIIVNHATIHIEHILLHVGDARKIFIEFKRIPLD
jgi:hypothetical protein